jgi:uncharacterized membrane protein
MNLIIISNIMLLKYKLIVLTHHTDIDIRYSFHIIIYVFHLTIIMNKRTYPYIIYFTDISGKSFKAASIFSFGYG